jgi:hypothetical protein
VKKSKINGSDPWSFLGSALRSKPVAGPIMASRIVASSSPNVKEAEDDPATQEAKKQSQGIALLSTWSANERDDAARMIQLAAFPRLIANR